MHDATATMHAAPAQHMQALQRATAVRVARAELKRNVERGEDGRRVVLDAPCEAASMTIAELTSQRYWGTIRSRKFQAGIGMPETKTIASMTERQRTLLAHRG